MQRSARVMCSALAALAITAPIAAAPPALIGARHAMPQLSGVAPYPGAHVAPAGRAPRQAQMQVPGAFRSSITLVPVDVRVLDREGRPVTDLKQEDFTILEDGVRQQIAHFSRQVLTPQPPAPTPTSTSKDEATPPLRRAPSYDIAPQKNRIFLIVLGRGRLREPSHAIEALLHFVRERLLPQDQVAVFAWNRATDFTTDHEKIAQVLERFDRAHEDIEGRLAFHFSSLAAAYGSKEIPAALQTKIDAVFSGAGGARPPDPGTPDAGLRTSDDRPVLPFRHLPPGVVYDSTRIAQDSQRIIEDLLSSGNDMMTDLPFEEFVSENARTMQDLGNLYTGIEYLRFLEGEKHLILATEKGLFLPREEDDKRIAEAANTARVVIDTFETGGLYVGQSPGATAGGPNPGQWSQFWAFSSLRTIADLTGGRSSIAQWGRVAVARIDDSTRAGYLLGYYPSNMKWDGRYRKITVKVTRRDLTLLYRHGYEATDQLVPFDRQAFLTFNRIISAALYPNDVRDIRLKVGASLKPAEAGTGREIVVDVKIDAARMSFKTENGLHVGALDIAIFVVDSHGRVIDERWQKIDLNLKDEVYERCRREGIPYLLRVPAKPRVREVKVIVYDYAADIIGSAVARVF
jgi:VWFA-related protein